MKNIQMFSLVLLSTILSSCEAIGAIFKTGMSVGIFIAVAVVVVIVIIVLKLGRNKS